MTLRKVLFIAAAAAVLVSPRMAAAQEAPEAEVTLELPAARQGYYIGGGFGSVFNTNFRTEDDDTGTLTGGGGYLRLGQLVTPWLGFGLQIGGGSASDDKGFSSGFGGLMLDVQLVPWDHLAIHAGVGAGGLSLTDPNADDGALEGTGGAYYFAGLSYDLFPFYDPGGSGGLSVTPAVQVQTMPGEIFNAFMITAGVEILWWSGLEKNKLDLPDGEGYGDED